MSAAALPWEGQRNREEYEERNRDRAVAARSRDDSRLAHADAAMDSLMAVGAAGGVGYAGMELGKRAGTGISEYFSDPKNVDTFSQGVGNVVTKTTPEVLYGVERIQAAGTQAWEGGTKLLGEQGVEVSTIPMPDALNPLTTKVAGFDVPLTNPENRIAQLNAADAANAEITRQLNNGAVPNQQMAAQAAEAAQLTAAANNPSAIQNIAGGMVGIDAQKQAAGFAESLASNPQMVSSAMGLVGGALGVLGVIGTIKMARARQKENIKSTF